METRRQLNEANHVSESTPARPARPSKRGKLALVIIVMVSLVSAFNFWLATSISRQPFKLNVQMAASISVQASQTKPGKSFRPRLPPSSFNVASDKQRGATGEDRDVTAGVIGQNVAGNHDKQEAGVATTKLHEGGSGMIGGSNHDGASPEDLEDTGECGDASQDPTEKGLEPPRLVSENAFQKGARPQVRWAVIFPFHGEKGSHRIDTVNISWTSIERAMQTALDRETKEAGKPRWGFDVLFVDDSNDQNWIPTSDVGNIYYCARMEGCTHKHHIYMHVKRGYRWGFHQGADFIIHFDSDLLVLADFFHRMYEEYKSQSCKTPVISGFTSAIQTIAYGANYMFDRATYRAIVKPAISSCHTGWDRQDSWGNKPWDNFVFDEHNAKCAPIWRPAVSWAFHIYSPESLHPAPIELSKGFIMDDFNHHLLASTTPYQIKAITTLAQVESRPCGYVQDVREVDPENGNKLNVQSTTNRTCKVRVGLAYSQESIVKVIRADTVEGCCKMCWETDGCEAFSFFEFDQLQLLSWWGPNHLCYMMGPDPAKDWKYETPVTSGFRVKGTTDLGSIAPWGFFK